MLISPPFLIDRGNLNEDDWIDACMVGGILGDGAFPISRGLRWHGGIHLTAPTITGTQVQPVRAIADGTLVYKRGAAPKPASREAEISHAQHYNRGWSDNGVVVIQHDTEIGEGVNARVIFFSIYMHLSALAPALEAMQTGRRIYRKAVIGQAGQIDGQTNRQIHFEIICDGTNLTRLVGRASGDLPLTADGRTDAVFGKMHFHLPGGTRFYTQRPALNQPAPTTAVAHTSTEELLIGLRYAGGEGALANQRGDVYWSTYRSDGTRLGAEMEDGDAEYNLYNSASAISDAYPDGARPIPSAVYELLRFGRVIGPDLLTPATVPHWQRVNYDGGQGWVNLNAANVRKFSDADFPHWLGWKLIDDTQDNDSRCNSPAIRAWLDTDGNGQVTLAEATTRAASAHVQAKLKRTICKFPTEWNAAPAVVEPRWGWLKTRSDDNPEPMDNDSFERFRRHIVALEFWTAANTGIPDNHWHFQPREFIRIFRRCGWLSEREMVQCMPRNSPAGLIPLATATARISTWNGGINKMARKFSLNSMLRLNHLLAHVWAETGYLRLMRESGADNARYAPYVGRGLIQITWEDKYVSYNKFAHVTRRGVGSNFNLELIATDEYHAGNSSGFYWVSKDFKDPLRTSKDNLSRIADEGLETNSIGKLCFWINGGGNHYDHRHIHAYFIQRILDDVDYANQPISQSKTFRKIEFVRETVMVNNKPVRKIIGTQVSNTPMTININYTPQR